MKKRRHCLSCLYKAASLVFAGFCIGRAFQWMMPLPGHACESELVEAMHVAHMLFDYRLGQDSFCRSLCGIKKDADKLEYVFEIDVEGRGGGRQVRVDMTSRQIDVFIEDCASDLKGTQ